MGAKILVTSPRLLRASLWPAVIGDALEWFDRGRFRAYVFALLVTSTGTKASPSFYQTDSVCVTLAALILARRAVPRAVSLA